MMLQATTLRYVTSFVKFTYWRKYEVSKSQKYSQVKHPAAWGCHPAALLQGGPVHERWEEVGSTLGTPVTPKGHKLGGKEAGEAKQKMAPRTWHSETQSERRGLWRVENTLLLLGSQPYPRASCIPIPWH